MAVTLEDSIAKVEDILRANSTTEKEEKIVLDYMEHVSSIWKKDRDQVLKELVGSLYDGLAYGNWPWTNYKEK